MSHTPGPWTAYERETPHGHHRILAGPPGANESRIALACRIEDARLIAAAPDLLAALERARQHLVMNEWVDDEGARRRFAAVGEVDGAIAKAKED